VDGDIVQIGQSVLTVAQGVCERLVAAGGEMVTIVAGVDADASAVSSLIEWLESSYPGIDVVLHDGGQPLWPLIVGVE
jgi:dihydroxyacetone kinase-like predicted kinase